MSARGRHVPRLSPHLLLVAATLLAPAGRWPDACAEIVKAKGERQELQAIGYFMDAAGQSSTEMPAEMILPVARQLELTRAVAAWQRGLALERLARQALALQETLHQQSLPPDALADLEYNLRALVAEGRAWSSVQRANGLMVATAGRLQIEERWPEEQAASFVDQLRALMRAKIPPLGNVPLADVYTLTPDRTVPPLQGALLSLTSAPVEQRAATLRLIQELVNASTDAAVTAIADRLEATVGAWRTAGLVTAEMAETLQLDTRTLAALMHLRRQTEARGTAALQALGRDFPEYRTSVQALREQRLSDVPTRSINVTPAAQWTSSNLNAVIMERNKALFVEEGASQISAAVGYTTSLPKKARVEPSYLIRLEVEPLQVVVERGRTVQLMARGLYSDQQARPVREGLRWSSRAPAIAAVANDGVVRGLRVGWTEITAVSGTLTSLPAQVRVFYPLWKRLLQWLLALAALLAAFWMFLATRRRGTEHRLVVLRKNDPRRFVIVVYHLLAHQWGWLGLPRKLSMIPEEYERVLQTKFGGTVVVALQTVTLLFLRANYSLAPVDAAQGTAMAEAYHALTAEVCGRLPVWQRVWLWMRGGMLRLGNGERSEAPQP